MKIIHVITACIVALLAIDTSLAQHKRAIFIHGFEGSAESWTAEQYDTRIPQDWVDRGLINSFEYFVYTTDQIKNDQERDALIAGLIQHMTAYQQNMPNTEWIFVGHSMGGLVARSIYGAIQQVAPYLQVKVVITMGTPHQGAPVTEVSFGDEPGFINVEPIFSAERRKIQRPLSHINRFVESRVENRYPGALERIDSAPEYLDTIRDLIEDWAMASSSIPAKDVIGTEGSVIRQINSPGFPNPPHMRSISGVEKRFVPVRAAGELVMKTGDELNILHNFDQIRDFYLANRKAWNTEITVYNFSGFNWFNPFYYRAKSKSEKWSEGYAALNNLDVTWSQMSNAFYTTTMQIPKVELVCPSGNRPSDFGFELEFEDFERRPATLSECYYQTVTRTITVRIPEKTDLVVTPMYAVWSPGQSPNDRNVNFLYDDTEPDGGYNHFEIRRMNRAYTLPDVFERGDITPPMDDVRAWFNEVVFRPGGTP